MAWLARLDARAAHWSALRLSAYLIGKWALVALGAFCLGRLWLDRLGIWSLY